MPAGAGNGGSDMFSVRENDEYLKPCVEGSMSVGSQEEVEVEAELLLRRNVLTRVSIYPLLPPLVHLSKQAST